MCQVASPSPRQKDRSLGLHPPTACPGVKFEEVDANRLGMPIAVTAALPLGPSALVAVMVARPGGAVRGGHKSARVHGGKSPAGRRPGDGRPVRLFPLASLVES